jgi:dihydropteroate synthase
MLLWQCRDRRIGLGTKPLVMGIVNVTPDSFSDGGRHARADAAARHGMEMLKAGADILDIGGESTRPGAAPVDGREELARVMPVVEALAGSGAVLSIDTTKASVARAALEAGAHIVNDVSAMTADPAMAGVARDAGAGVVLMHMQGSPRTMQVAPSYGDVVAEVASYLAGRLRDLAAAGMPVEAMAVDPGIGFGKTTAHNLSLLAGLRALAQLGRPVVIGCSRKRFIGEVTGRPVEGRMAGSLGAAAAAVLLGANVLRVHDVAESRDAALVAAAVAEAGGSLRVG